MKDADPDEPNDEEHDDPHRNLSMSSSHWTMFYPHRDLSIWPARPEHRSTVAGSSRGECWPACERRRERGRPMFARRPQLGVTLAAWPDSTGGEPCLISASSVARAILARWGDPSGAAQAGEPTGASSSTGASPSQGSSRTSRASSAADRLAGASGRRTFVPSRPLWPRETLRRIGGVRGARSWATEASGRERSGSLG